MNSPIFAEEGAFDESHIPQKIHGREGHIQELENCLLPLKQNKFAKNLYVFGPSGSGKTITVRHVLKKHFDKNHVYINCWRKRTSHKVMDSLLRKLGFMVHGRESTSDLVKKLEESKRDFVVCLDEVDQLKDSNVLYDLARHSKGLVLISNTPYSDFQLDQRIKNRLFLHDVEFAPYQNKDIFSLLKSRVIKGLQHGTIDNKILLEAAGLCNGDARMALQIIRAAARDAELKNEDSITINHIRSAAKSSRRYNLSYLTGKLNEHQRILYSILKENKTMGSGKLYREYLKSVSKPVTSRGYRKYIQRMKDLGLVRESGSGRWKRYEII